MQETHAEQNVENIWDTEYGGKIYFANGESNARGVCIMFRKGLNYSVNKVTKDPTGRFIILDCVIEDKELLLANIYMPNEDNPRFAQSVFETLSNHKYADRIIAGDFNLVMDEEKDAYNRKNNNKKAANIFKSYFDETMMIDTWRAQNPDVFQFTYFKRKPNEIFARLDYIFVNYALMAHIEKVNINPAYKTDHCAVNIVVNLNAENKRGPGFWKVNMSIFNNRENIEKMNDVIKDTISEFKDCDRCTRWEAVKAEIINNCKKWSKERAKKMHQEVDMLREKLSKLNERLQPQHLTNVEKDAICTEINEWQNKLNTIMQSKAVGARIRSKSVWYEKVKRTVPISLD